MKVKTNNSNDDDKNNNNKNNDNNNGFKQNKKCSNKSKSNLHKRESHLFLERENHLLQVLISLGEKRWVIQYLPATAFLEMDS